MDAVMGYISSHQGLLLVAVVIIIILIVFIIFRSVIKSVLILFLLVTVLFGFYFLKDPDKLSEKINQSINLMKSGVSQIVDKSKSFLKDTKELYKKSKNVPGDFNKMLKESEQKANK